MSWYRNLSRNARTGVLMFAIVFGMVGVAYASVPLYRLFCQVTGFGGTPQVAVGAEAPGATARTISIRFDANTDAQLPWRFRAEEVHRTIPIGSRNIAFYTARNDSGVPVTGQASFNVTPAQAGRYFTKIHCFCFEEQTLQPFQEVRMPVTFYVDPAILNDPDARNISEITLSYTFYKVDRAAAAR
ncbi:MAG TPA: cytochrome c oxidase assembly protein [Allosphingosinicella sp.]|nr:cytochrome c oxidase assembly protein [Allosphingosinicella sp.]